MDDDSSVWPSGDAWQGYIAAWDADTGDEIWRFTLPLWKHYEARGSYINDIFLPDCFGSPTANVDGNIYVIHWSGTAYCLEGGSGKILSETDVKGSSQSAPVILPGLLLLPQCYNVVAFRDEKLESEWLEAARAKGDKRADPRLWAHHKQVLIKADKEAINMALHVHPNCGAFPKTECVEIGHPWKEYSKETWQAKCRRLAAKSGAFPDDAPRWFVIGGGKSGGITVRKGEGLKTEELGRLATGAQIKQLGLKGERLHYQKEQGEGPETGWVSLTLKGQNLLRPALFR